MDVRGRRVLVVGLARSGRAAAECLVRRGAVVTVTDQKPPAAFPSEIAELLPLKVGLELGAHQEKTFLGHDLIVVSPGVPWDMPMLVEARRRSIQVVPEVEVASWYLSQPILGITGSNGKTTTTSLVGKMLDEAAMPAFVGGNIGVPLISAVDRTSADAWLVAELSSFQLEGIETFRPRVAVLLNLSRNHLDRHPSFESYIAAKARIFWNQREDDVAILNADDESVMALAPSIAARKVYFSRRQNLPDGVFVSKGAIRYRVGNLERALVETAEIPLRGGFNVENVAAAAAAAAVAGADFEAIRAAVMRFRGVEHRLEFVRDIRHVQFFNDSKATSVDAAAKSLSAFESGVHLILGGKDKGAPYAPLAPLIEGRVREVLVIGAAAEKIARELAGAVEIVQAGNLETAVREAFLKAVPGDIILLAPACSSYDQFQDFEHRGRVFKELVDSLAREVEAAPLRLESREVPPTQNSSARSEPGSAGPPSAAEGASPRSRAATAEWHYVYEVSAEELAPRSEEMSQETGGGAEAPAIESSRPLESLSDQRLPYEVRGDASGGQDKVVKTPGDAAGHPPS